MRVNAPAVELSAWDRRRNDVAMHIERCAMELFVAQGIDETTVEDIARAAGISRRTFYRYFGTIDDLLIAQSKRSLKRISESVARRPLSESIREAFVNATVQEPPSEMEQHILGLGGRLHDLYPQAWWRAMGRVQAMTQEVYETAVADRLRATGQDPRFAPMIGAVLVTVIGHTARQYFNSGKFSHSGRPLDEALSALADVLK